MKTIKKQFTDNSQHYEKQTFKKQLKGNSKNKKSFKRNKNHWRTLDEQFNKIKNNFGTAFKHSKNK